MFKEIKEENDRLKHQIWWPCLKFLFAIDPGTFGHRFGQTWAFFFVIWLWLWYRGVFLCISFMQMKASLINVLQVHNEVATLTAGTMLMIEKTTPHAPSNVTVTRKETFAVTIEWLPGYSGCSHCEQTYKIRWEST